MDSQMERSLRGTVFTISGRSIIATCKHCAAKEILPNGAIRDVGDIRRRLLGRDWQINGQGTWAICPDCIIKQKSINKRRHEVNGKEVVKPAADNVDKKRFAKILLEINTNFDETTSKYLNGKSDEIIAKQFDVSPKFVTETREQYVGKLAREPDELDKLRDDFKAMTDLLVSEISALNEKIKAMDADFTRRYDKIRALVRSEGH